MERTSGKFGMATFEGQIVCSVKFVNLVNLLFKRFKDTFLFSEAGPCNKHSESLVGIRAALWRAPIAFTTMVIADTDEKEAAKNKKKKRATFNLIKKQRPREAPEGTEDLLWSQKNVVKGLINFYTFNCSLGPGLQLVSFFVSSQHPATTLGQIILFQEISQIIHTYGQGIQRT